jgi:hypothetical protein
VTTRNAPEERHAALLTHTLGRTDFVACYQYGVIRPRGSCNARITGSKPTIGSNPGNFPEARLEAALTTE